MLAEQFPRHVRGRGWKAGDAMAQPEPRRWWFVPDECRRHAGTRAAPGTADAAICSLPAAAYSCEIVDIGLVRGTNTARSDGGAQARPHQWPDLRYVDSISLTISLDYGGGVTTR